MLPSETIQDHALNCMTMVENELCGTYKITNGVARNMLSLTHPCISIFVRTFPDIMHSPAPWANPNPPSTTHIQMSSTLQEYD